MTAAEGGGDRRQLFLEVREGGWIDEQGIEYSGHSTLVTDEFLPDSGEYLHFLTDDF